jgi:enhancing lycopene biosynthesis protein 2
MAGAKTVGVVLSGCGYLDGAEIQEATLTLLALDRAGAAIKVFAPDVEQMHVVDHRAQKPAAGERRNVLAESARIARGAAEPLARARGAELDALIFPGGFGAAKNLSTFAVDGKGLKVLPDVERLVREVHGAGKPLGFICIAPVIGAKVLGGEGVVLTIGDDLETASALESLGARHRVCKVDEIAVDERLKVVSTPAYMLGPSIARVAAGIDKLVAKVLALA